MNKFISIDKKYWYVVFVAGVIIGAGSIGGATARGKEIISDPKTIVKG